MITSLFAHAWADRLQTIETSAIRELFKVLGQPGMISFAGGFPDATLFDVDGIAQASQQVLQHHAGPALQYGATEGIEMLRQTIADRYATPTHPTLTAQNVLITTGSQQALDLIAKTLINPGDVVLVEGPTFLATIQCFRLYGAHLITIPVDANGVDPEALRHLITQHQPKLVYLIPTFGNPSGATLRLDRRHEVLSILQETQTLLVEDDPYGQLYFDTPPPPSLLELALQRDDGVAHLILHCGSLSKVLSPGLRIGWLIATHPDGLNKAVMCKQFSDAHTSTFAQYVAAYYLQSGRMAQALSKVRQAYAERAHAMTQALTTTLPDRLSFVAPQGGLFIWAKLVAENSRFTNSAELAKAAIGQKVAFVPGSPFYAQNPDPQTLRLSFATVNEALITEGVARLASVM